MNTSEAALLDALLKERDRRKIEEERQSLAEDFMSFVSGAWHILKPHEPFIHNWHLDAIAAYLTAVSKGHITRLQVWIPPGSMKTGMVSVYWHAWEWTTRPWLRYWTGSYETRLIQRFSIDAQRVITSPWWQARWGQDMWLTSEAAHYWGNNHGGTRLATSPSSTGTGEHGHRIIVDDPIPARAAEVTDAVQKSMKTLVMEANDWWDGTVASRGLDNEELGFQHARVLVMQRLHQDDLAAHMLEQEDWTILCLPERYEAEHPYAWRGERVHPKVELPPDLSLGDPRAEGELLWPARRDEHSSNVMSKQMLSHRAAAQLQQRPAAKEGEILKVDWWRFYDNRIRDKEEWDKIGRFGMTVITVDTPLKDKESNDNVAVQCWGIKGADRYLLDLRLGKMNYGLAKRTIREMSQWARKRFRCRHHVLIENAGYGPELIIDLKREITGVTKISPAKEGNKEQRAEAASDALESGNYFLPGYGPPWQPAYDEHRTPADVASFVHNCAMFPNASHDDDVDAWSQFGNWMRDKSANPIRTSLPRRR